MDGYLKGVLFPSIELRLGDEWGQLYGYSDGRPVQLILVGDEKVMSIYGTYNGYMQQIVITTTNGRVIYYGNARGKNEFSDDSPNPSFEFLGFCGYYVRSGIRAIKAIWGTPGSTCA